MCAIAEINVGGAGFVSFDEFARARPRERVASFVVLCQVCFRLYDLSRAILPDQFGADQISRARDRVPLEKRCPNDPAFHSGAEARVGVLETWCVEIHRDSHRARHWFSFSKGGDEFRLAQIVEGSISESEKWWLLSDQRQLAQISTFVDFCFELG